MFEQQLVVSPCLGVVAELVVSKGEVVEAFATSLGGRAEDFGEELDAGVLVVAGGGFYQALGWCQSGSWRGGDL